MGVEDAQNIFRSPGGFCVLFEYGKVPAAGDRSVPFPTKDNPAAAGRKCVIASKSKIFQKGVSRIWMITRSF